MKVKFHENFLFELNKQVDFISSYKPDAARKFKNDLLRNIRKDLKRPFHFKKSGYYENVNIRDYVFKGYVSVYYIDEVEKSVSVFGFIKYKDSL